jgi:hypothetical protein
MSSNLNELLPAPSVETKGIDTKDGALKIRELFSE